MIKMLIHIKVEFTWSCDQNILSDRLCMRQTPLKVTIIIHIGNKSCLEDSIFTSLFQ